MSTSSTIDGWHERRRTQDPEPGHVRRILVELPAASWNRAEAVAEAVGEMFPTANIEVAKVTATTRSVVIDGARDHGDRSFALELVDRAVASLGFKIEAQTAAGPISFQPYESRAAAERDLPRRKRSAPSGVIRGSWKILPIERGSPEASPSHTRAGRVDLTPRERLSLRALDHIIKAMRANRDPAEAAEAILEIVANHAIDHGEDVAGHASPTATPRVRLMLSALDHIVKEVHSDHDDVAVEEAIAEILANHGIGAGDVDEVLRTAALREALALSAEEHAALAEAKKRIGRRWKAAVRLAWETGNYSDLATADEELPSALQRLRNASYFGPSGLAAYKANPGGSSTGRVSNRK